MNFFKYLLFLCLSLFSSFVSAQLLQTDDAIELLIKHEGASNGIPIRKLNTDNWSAYYINQPHQNKAWESISFELSFILENEWRLGLVNRVEASINMSPDTALLAVLSQANQKPQNSTYYNINAKDKLWKGEGFRAKSPWIDFSDSNEYKGQFDFQFLELNNFKSFNINGGSSYTLNSGYQTNVMYEKEFSSTNNPFLQLPDKVGRAYSLSLGVRRNGADSYIQLYLQDLFSKIKWGIVKEYAGYNNYLSNSIPSGIVGRQYYSNMSTNMGLKIKAESAVNFDNSKTSFKTELISRDGLTQLWVGLASKVGNEKDINNSLVYFSGYDPILNTVKLSLGLSGFNFGIVKGIKGNDAQVFGASLTWMMLL